VSLCGNVFALPAFECWSPGWEVLLCVASGAGNRLHPLRRSRSCKHGRQNTDYSKNETEEGPGGTDVFSMCPDGHEGVVGGHTSCAFAANVRQIFYASGMSNNFTAYSPVTGDGYEMTCVGRYRAYFNDGSTTISTRCYGGDNAEVVVW
jgi:hypothetical protein